jgi:hypothetical protein
MGKNDMNHMQHIESVALSDCAVLQSKESTYQGSWKRAGGRSAWFMARRNLDRLITMMSPKEFSPHIQTPANVHDTLQMLENIVHYNGNAYSVKDLPGSIDATMQIIRMVRDSYFSEDIFRKIAEAPGGEDGTVLACLRDARRYFTLVEAEMIAEGLVEPETKTYETDNEWDGEGITDLRLEMENGQIYTIKDIESFTIERKHRICDITLRRKGVEHRAPTPPKNVDLDPYELVASENGMTVGQLKEYLLDHVHPTPPPSPSNGGYAQEQRAKHEDAEQQNHAATNPLWPWQITQAEYTSVASRVGPTADFFYTRRAPDLFQLEAVVGSRFCPKELAACYEYAADNRWVLKKQNVPEELRENYRELQVEMNKFEHETSHPDYRFMYDFDDGAQKFILREQFRVAWGKDQA